MEKMQEMNEKILLKNGGKNSKKFTKIPENPKSILIEFVNFENYGKNSKKYQKLPQKNSKKWLKKFEKKMT